MQENNEYLINKIVRESGCDSKLAKMLLSFTKGDENGVIRILSSIPKNILVIKGKFIASNRGLYGVFLIYYDKNSNEVVKTHGFVSKKKEIGNIDIRLDSDEIVKTIDTNLQNNAHDMWDKLESQELLARMAQILGAEYWPKVIKEAQPAMLEREIIRAFDRMLNRFLNDNQLAIKVNLANINEFQFNRRDAADVVEEDEPNVQAQMQETREAKENANSDELAQPENSKSFVMLQSEIDVAPVHGLEMKNIQIGDEVFARIIDQRDVAQYLKTLLLQNAGHENDKKPILGKVAGKKELDTGNIQLILEYGPGIHGVLADQMEVRAHVLDRKADNKNANKKDHKKDNRNSTEKANFFFWLIMLGSLCLLIMVIAYLMMKR